ncbi:MAG: type II toxin-antitoxin system RelE/ParE family toxin [Candidatus Magasanikbacteria bacterium]
MSFKVKLQKKAKKQMESLEPQKQERVNDKLRDLMDFYDGKEVAQPDIKTLKGKYKGLLRLRVGDYRVVFKMSHKKEVIIILEVKKRKDAY